MIVDECPIFLPDRDGEQAWKSRASHRMTFFRDFSDSAFLVRGLLSGLPGFWTLFPSYSQFGRRP
jgi:hypothetical protein